MSNDVGRRRNRRVLTKVGVYTLLIAGAMLAIFPLLWMVSASFMATGEASTYPPHIIPRHFTLDNYRSLFTRLSLGRSLANSALIASVVAAVPLARRAPRSELSSGSSSDPGTTSRR